MEVKAQHKNARMSAQKVRLVRNVILGLPVLEAEAQLQYLPGKAAQIVLQVLKSAVANAGHNFEIEQENLKVADLVVDEGLVMKRIRPVSRGMAHGILKRMCHVTVVVEETGAGSSKKRKAKKAKIETITTHELLKQEKTEHDTEKEDEQENTEVKASKTEKVTKEEKTTQKIKTQQQGGDRVQTHRRKSLKGN